MSLVIPPAVTDQIFSQFLLRSKFRTLRKAKFQNSKSITCFEENMVNLSQAQLASLPRVLVPDQEICGACRTKILVDTPL